MSVTSPNTLGSIPATLAISPITAPVVTFSRSILSPPNTEPNILSAAGLPVDTLTGPCWGLSIPPPALGLAKTKPPDPV